MQDTKRITILLNQLRSGSRSVENELVELVYPDLRRIARNYLARERSGHTLQATAIVNEVYVQLIGQYSKSWENRAHFFAVAAALMRRILVDHARKRSAQKRGAGAPVVAMEDEHGSIECDFTTVVAVDDALRRLADIDQRKASIVAMKYFGGMNEAEIAEVMGVSKRTVKRDWAFSKAWLYSELR